MNKKTYKNKNGALIRIIKAVTFYCFDETHLHKTPVQNMVALEINGHFVEATQDGDRYGARIDGKRVRFDLTLEQLDQFIKDSTT